jgi:hypothetical protein
MIEVLSYVAAALSVVAALMTYIQLARKQREMVARHVQLLSFYRHALGAASTSSAITQDHLRAEVTEILSNTTKSLSSISGKSIEASLQLFSGTSERELFVSTYVSTSPTKGERQPKLPVQRETAYSQIIHGGKSFLSNDLTATANYMTTSSLSMHRSLLVVPVTSSEPNDDSRKRLVGTLTFSSKEPSAFKDESVRFAYSVSDLIAALLERAFSQARNDA